MTEQRRFALLDRDGTINEEVDHLSDPDELVLIPGSAEAIGRLAHLNLGVVVVTNQAQIGRGALTAERLDQIHDRLQALLRRSGAEVEAIMVCPHTPGSACRCRKPQPGMAIDAAERFGFDLARSFVVGDHAGDVGMGRAIGAKTFLVMTGHGPEELERAGDLADHVVPDLAGAVDIIATLIDEEHP
jgi:histidinol-phosphate phosphatase family protein